MRVAPFINGIRFRQQQRGKAATPPGKPKWRDVVMRLRLLTDDGVSKLLVLLLLACNVCYTSGVERQKSNRVGRSSPRRWL